MPLPRQPLEAIPCLLAMRTFISASRPMAKTVVSAVKPGGQAMRPCLSGFLVCASPLGSSAQITAPCASAVSGGLRRCKYSQLLRLLLRQLFQFSALQPIPIRSAHLASSIRAEDPLAIGHWRLYIDNGGCPWWGDCSPAVGRGSHRGVQPVGCLSKPCARSPVEGWCGARKGARSEPGENSPFVAPARIQCACRGRSSFGNAPGGAFVIHWIHVSIFFPQQNVRRT